MTKGKSTIVRRAGVINSQAKTAKNPKPGVLESHDILIKPHLYGTNFYLSEIGIPNNEVNRLVGEYGKDVVKQAVRIHAQYLSKNGAAEEASKTFEPVCSVVRNFGKFAAYFLLVKRGHDPAGVEQNFDAAHFANALVVFPRTNCLEDRVKDGTKCKPELSVSYRRPEVMVLDYIQK